MKVTREIDIEPKYYFNHLCNRAIKDIKKATNKKINIDELMDGYKYQRTVSMKNNKIHINFEVGPLIKDKYFEVKYETEETKCLYYYDFSYTNEKYYVTYSEDNSYKKHSLGNSLSDFGRQLFQNKLKRNIFNNIEMTLNYIKENELENKNNG